MARKNKLERRQQRLVERFDERSRYGRDAMKGSLTSYAVDVSASGGGDDCYCLVCTMRRLMISRSSSDQLDQGSSGAHQRETELRQQLAEYLTDVGDDVGWDDVVGNDAARAALQEAVEHPHTRGVLHAHYGVRLARGAVLHGPPGCGKTMYAKAAAGALARLHGESTTLISVKGAQIQQLYVGRTEKIIREMFELARLYFKRTGRQVVMFFDEADALLPSRDARHTYGYQQSNVATFLSEMDGLDGVTGAFVLLATNRLQAIDAAALRDGRCDHVIRVSRPDVVAATTILANNLKGVPLSGAETKELASAAATYFFDSAHVLECAVMWRSPADETESGVEHLTLGSVCSGAMMVGLVERAKRCAVARDHASGKLTGVDLRDFYAATAQVHEENRSLFHGVALEEMIERLGKTAKMRDGLRVSGPHDGMRVN